MKIFHFVVLGSIVIYLSSQAVQGRLVFTQDYANLSEGSTVTFICQDTERVLTLKNTWTFQNGSLDIVLSENGTLASGLNRDKYKLKISGTELKIINLTVNDSGNYRCIIRGGNGEILLSATAALTVKASFSDRQTTNSSSVFVSSTQSVLSPVTHQLQPSPTASSVPSAAMQKTVFPGSASVSEKGNIDVTVGSQETSPCDNSTKDTDVAFIKDRSSPNLVTINEGDLLVLQCNYCVVSSIDSAVLSWFKEDVAISNDTRHVFGKNNLVVPKTEQGSDEGLYTCVVTFEKQNISRFITVIVKKDHSNPLLSSVSAQNKSYLSVQITWRLTDHGVFTSAIVSLRLRLLNSSDWSHVIANITHDHGLYKFECLQPCSMYLLNISLYNRNKQVENRALVFWSAATNSSVSDMKTLLLFQVTNRRALGVALGIVGLLLLAMIMYACVTWCQDDKKGYSVPPGQQNKQETAENDALFSVTSSMYYNRAFEDDKVHWMLDEETIS